MEKRKVILIGSSTCGKTTLCQRLNGLTIHYHKTQTIGLINNMIDTPGEYLENRNMYKGIIVAATDSDLVLFLQDATDERFRFSPGQRGRRRRRCPGRVILSEAKNLSLWVLRSFAAAQDDSSQGRKLPR